LEGIVPERLLEFKNELIYTQHTYIFQFIHMRIPKYFYFFASTALVGTSHLISFM